MTAQSVLVNAYLTVTADTHTTGRTAVEVNKGGAYVIKFYVIWHMAYGI
jgi:hypothetical protein